jgi:hypothetical protein
MGEHSRIVANGGLRKHVVSKTICLHALRTTVLNNERCAYCCKHMINECIMILNCWVG